MEDVISTYMKSINSMGLPELEFMSTNQEYRQDCILTSPNIVALDNKVQ